MLTRASSSLPSLLLLLLAAAGSVFIDISAFEAAGNANGRRNSIQGRRRSSQIDPKAAAQLRRGSSLPGRRQSAFMGTANRFVRALRHKSFKDSDDIGGAKSGAPVASGSRNDGTAASAKVMQQTPHSAEAFKARAGSAAKATEDRVAAEMRVQAMWRLRFRDAPGVEAEIAKMHATATAKAIFAAWEAEQTAQRIQKDAEAQLRVSLALQGASGSSPSGDRSFKRGSGEGGGAGSSAEGGGGLPERPSLRLSEPGGEHLSLAAASSNRTGASDGNSARPPAFSLTSNRIPGDPLDSGTSGLSA